MKILIVDNYDSFTFNLYQYVGEILGMSNIKHQTSNVDVVRNDKITLGEIKKRKYDRIVLSPGPGNPADSKYFGVCADILLKTGKTIPVLGVCLGMQGIAYYYGGKIVKAAMPMHGKTSIISHDGKGVLKGLPQGIEVMRYHSLVADPESLPDCLEISAIVSSRRIDRNEIFKNLPLPESKYSVSSNLSGDMEIMGLRHKKYPIEGIQFHPESFATEGGKILLSNFLFGNNREL